MDYNRMAEKAFLNDQYCNDTALNIRKSLHQKYSTNKQGYNKWLFNQYKFMNGNKILELGSGNGDIWEPYIDDLTKMIDITLSDYSQGMVDILKEKYATTGVKFQKIDIQNIPFSDKTFDVVIANAMLYHVPNIEKALSEVQRILKPGGTFYTSTFGEKGLFKYINDCLSEIGIKTSNTMNINFTLQNGKNQLEKIFSVVQRVDYEDSLTITDVMDLVHYIYSLTSISGSSTKRKEDLVQLLETKQKEKGVLSIQKEYGMFISKP